MRFGFIEWLPASKKNITSWLKLDGTANRLALAGLLVFVLLALFVICSNSSVNDEYAAHITGGYFYWHTGQFAGGVDNPPLGQLWVSLPLILTGAPLTPFSNELVWLVQSLCVNE